MCLDIVELISLPPWRIYKGKCSLLEVVLKLYQRTKRKTCLRMKPRVKVRPNEKKTATSENVSQGMVSSLVKWWNSGAAKFTKVKLMHYSTITIDRVSCPMIPGHRTLALTLSENCNYEAFSKSDPSSLQEGVADPGELQNDESPINTRLSSEMQGKGLGAHEAEINRWLPAEMLEKVFRHLHPRDLKVAVLVCKR